MKYTIEYFFADPFKTELTLNDNCDKMSHNIYYLLKFRNIKFIIHISKIFYIMNLIQHEVTSHRFTFEFKRGIQKIAVYICKTARVLQKTKFSFEWISRNPTHLNVNGNSLKSISMGMILHKHETKKPFTNVRFFAESIRGLSSLNIIV